MQIGSVVFILIGIATLFVSGGACAGESFHYQVSYLAAGDDRLSISVDLPEIPPGPKTLVFPRAIPMGYTQEPYDRYVANIEVFDANGAPMSVSRDEGPRWIIGDKHLTISRISYEIDVARMEREILDSSDASKRRSGYLSLLGYSVFAYLEGFTDRPIRLSIEVPVGWPVTSTLAPVVPPSMDGITVAAENFYALADSQIIAGPDARIYRLRGATPLYLSLYAEGEVDVPLLSSLMEESMSAVVDYFGSAPFPHFTTVQELLRPISDQHNYNYSMEHLLSATFYLADDRGVTSKTEPVEIERIRFNYAHHFAHAWIPKRISGKGYRPFNWELAPVIDTIWFSEGFAQYLAMSALAELVPEPERSDYLERMIASRFRDNLNKAPLFSQQMSLLELSRSASTLSSHDFRTLRNVSSRGGLMAADMDALIREESGGTRTLKDGLRYLMHWNEGKHSPLDMEELPALLERAVGVDTTEVLHRWKLSMK